MLVAQAGCPDTQESLLVSSDVTRWRRACERSALKSGAPLRHFGVGTHTSTDGKSNDGKETAQGSEQVQLQRASLGWPLLARGRGGLPGRPWDALTVTPDGGSVLQMFRRRVWAAVHPSGSLQARLARRRLAVEGGLVHSL